MIYPSLTGLYLNLKSQRAYNMSHLSHMLAVQNFPLYT